MSFTRALLAALLALPGVSTETLAMEPRKLERGYVPSPYGQLHYVTTTAPTPPERATIVLFHQTPGAAGEYRELMSALSGSHRVIAFDTPGFGASDGPPAPVSIGDYADAFASGLRALGIGPREEVAVFGFHTGAVIALEMAHRHAGLVDALMFAGMPFHSPTERASRLAKLPREAGVGALEARLQEYWRLAIAGKPADVSDERAMQLFVDAVAGRHTYWYSYDAVWRYPFEERLAAVKQPALVLAPHEMLLEPTRRAAAAMAHAQLVELPGLATQWVLQVGAAELAAPMKRFLEAPPACLMPNERCASGVKVQGT